MVAVEDDLGKRTIAAGGNAKAECFRANGIHIAMLTLKKLDFVGIRGIYHITSCSGGSSVVHVPRIFILYSGKTGAWKLAVSDDQTAGITVRVSTGRLISAGNIDELMLLPVVA